MLSLGLIDDVTMAVHHDLQGHALAFLPEIGEKERAATQNGLCFMLLPDQR